MNADRHRERIVGFVPLPAGWRAVYVSRDPGGDLDTAPDDYLYYTMPVACLAHVEIQWYDHNPDEHPSPFDSALETELRPVIAEEDKYLAWDGYNPVQYLMLLGPGDSSNPRSRAIDAIERERKAAAAAAAYAQETAA